MSLPEMPSPTAAAARPTASEAAAEAALPALAELVAVVDRLRDPEGGCPWDLEQTHASLIPYVLEEAHEVADAIRHGDDHHLEEELGDLLLQVVLHARIASEAGRFNLETVARAITAKLIRRHPHVFGDAEAADSAAVRASWEAIKAQERLAREIPASDSASIVVPPGAAAAKRADDPACAGRQTMGPDAANSSSAVAASATQQASRPLDPSLRGPATGPASAAPAAGSASPLTDHLAGKVRGQPALAGAMTISRKAAAAGFEWDAMGGVWEKVQEELEELRDAVASGDRNHAQEELGDVLFTLVNVARWAGVEPEEGLAGTNQRFLQRFARVEAALGGDLQGRSIKELEGLWQQAKADIRAERQAADA